MMMMMMMMMMCAPDRNRAEQNYITAKSSHAKHQAHLEHNFEL
jgi:hypothetical protein